MAVRAFSVGAHKGLVAASATNLPNMVAIAGPNGAGKSALLEQLWRNRESFLEPGTEMLYIGPHRTWRAGTVSDIGARTFVQDYGDVLKQENMPGFQYVAPGGQNWLSGLARLGSNADDSQALVKTAIIRISNKAESFLASEYRRQGGMIASGSVPDLLKPLSELVDILLPHLVFVGVDQTDPQNIRVYFSPRASADPGLKFDIDELSSGEKAAVALFLPFIEREVKVLIEASEAGETPTTDLIPLTVLIDEPEIHLHPILQLNVLEYMRSLGYDNRAQFVITTHSPSMLDALDTEELLLLSPSAVAPSNQLARITDSLEKLEVARTITGATHLLTRGKPIVFVEGEPDAGSTASDQRIIKILVPRIEHWAVIPSHGKSQVARAVTDMRAARLHLPGMPVFGLVDGDLGSSTSIDSVVSWPVAMMENLLLDKKAIFEVIKHYSLTGLSQAAHVEASLQEVVASLKEAEISRRLAAQIPSVVIRPTAHDAESIQKQVEDEVAEYLAAVGKLDVDSLRSAAEAEVHQIITDGHELERFHGKKILRGFYDKHRISSTGMGKGAFATEVARHAAGGERLTRLTEKPISQIQLYFPPNLVELIEKQAQSPDRDGLLERCRQERANWESGTPQHASREQLRTELIQYIRTLDASADASALLDASVSIGTIS